ncbi:MAG TPA: hypothetical protein VFN74_06955 [Chloroflexota bacterium]|nr:hypothetical protein [Chloroflexota bacterium]
MAELATLDTKHEAQLRELERETGAWMVAFAPPDAGQRATAPGFAGRLTPAPLDGTALQRLQALERQAGCCVVAYRPIADA